MRSINTSLTSLFSSPDKSLSAMGGCKKKVQSRWGYCLACRRLCRCLILLISALWSIVSVTWKQVEFCAKLLQCVDNCLALQQCPAGSWLSTCFRMSGGKLPQSCSTDPLQLRAFATDAYSDMWSTRPVSTYPPASSDHSGGGVFTSLAFDIVMLLRCCCTATCLTQCCKR